MTTTRLKWHVASGVALITLLVGALFLASRDDQPRYAGKRLSAWLDELTPLQSNIHAVGNRKSAQSQAVRAIGTNALPWLLREMHVEGRGLFGWINWALDKQPFLNFRLPDPSYRLGRACNGFLLLGELAEPAIPDLLVLLDSKPGFVPAVLAFIGPSAVPALHQCLTNTRPSGQLVADPGNTIASIQNAVYLGRLSESDVAILIPTIREWAQTTNHHASHYAVDFLQALKR